MATHDYVIANGTGAAVRSDLNNALAAIVSNNSGSSEPSTTYAFQWWADTNANVLKIRNSANNGWITLRELDGTMLVEDGSAGSPGLAFADDTDTGIYSPGANQIGLATGGAERLKVANSQVVVNEDSNDVDFRVESNDKTHMLFVDGGENRVGIGTIPAEVFEVQSASNTTIRIDNEDDSTAKVLFHNTGSTDRQIAVTSGAMTFGGTSTEFARIDNNGRFLVGITASQNVGFAHNLQVEGTDGGSSSLSLIRNSNDTNGPHVDFAKTRGTATASNTVVQSGDDLGNLVFRGADGTDKGSIAVQIQAQVDGTPGSNDMPGRLVIKTSKDGAASPTERMRIANDGALNHFTDTFFTVRTARTAGSEGAIFVKNAASSTSTGANAFIVRADGDCENTNNSYGAISDAKLKENIVDASSQWDDIKDLRVRNYNFIEGQTHTQIGVVAQEVETVSPGLVSESPDRDEEGNDLGTTTKSVNYSVLYMKAVKALQEAMDRIETLEAKVAALEAG